MDTNSQWAERNSSSREFANATADDVRALETDLEDSPFLFGENWDHNEPTEMFARMPNASTPPQLFEGIIIDTGANRSSIMSQTQYDSYCDTFGVLHQIVPTSNL